MLFKKKILPNVAEQLEKLVQVVIYEIDVNISHLSHKMTCGCTTIVCKSLEKMVYNPTINPSSSSFEKIKDKFSRKAMH